MLLLFLFHVCLLWVMDVLTHWGRDKMNAISQTTFSSAFSWMKMFEFRLKFHWNMFLRVQLTIFQHWLRLWLGAGQATSHYLNQWWSVYRRIYASLGLNELIQKVAPKVRMLSNDFTLNVWFCDLQVFKAPSPWQPTPRHTIVCISYISN